MKAVSIERLDSALCLAEVLTQNGIKIYGPMTLEQQIIVRVKITDHVKKNYTVFYEGGDSADFTSHAGTNRLRDWGLGDTKLTIDGYLDDWGTLSPTKAQELDANLFKVREFFATHKGTAEDHIGNTEMLDLLQALWSSSFTERYWCLIEGLDCESLDHERAQQYFTYTASYPHLSNDIKGEVKSYELWTPSGVQLHVKFRKNHQWFECGFVEVTNAHFRNIWITELNEQCGGPYESLTIEREVK